VTRQHWSMRDDRSPNRVAGIVLLAASTIVLPPRCDAQVTNEDYARAERLLSWNAEQLISGDRVEPRWLDAHTFWYDNHVLSGHEFIVIDIAANRRRPAFDHGRLAAALSRASHGSYDPATCR
jgi:hypothetical protein